MFHHSFLKDVVHARRTSRLFQNGRMGIPTPFFLRDGLGAVALSFGQLPYPASIGLTSTAGYIQDVPSTRLLYYDKVILRPV